jgi:hypothetical protein
MKRREHNPALKFQARSFRLYNEKFSKSGSQTLDHFFMFPPCSYRFRPGETR